MAIIRDCWTGDSGPYQNCDWQEGLHYGAQLAVCYAGQMVDLCVGEAEFSLSLNLGRNFCVFFGGRCIQNSEDDRFSDLSINGRLWAGEGDDISEIIWPPSTYLSPLSKTPKNSVSYPPKIVSIPSTQLQKQSISPQTKKNGLQLLCVLGFSPWTKETWHFLRVGRVEGGFLRPLPPYSVACHRRQRQGSRWLRSMSCVGVPVSSRWWLWLWHSCRCEGGKWGDALMDGISWKIEVSDAKVSY